MLTEPETNTIARTAYKDAAEPSNLDAMLYLGIEHDDMYNSVKQIRMTDVLKYASQFSDGLNVLRKVVLKVPRGERVDRAWEYMQMRQELDRRSEAVKKYKESMGADEDMLKSLQRDIEDYEK